MAVTALHTRAGWQRRGCFIPPPPSDSLTPAELSCGKRPRLCPRMSPPAPGGSCRLSWRVLPTPLSSPWGAGTLCSNGPTACPGDQCSVVGDPPAPSARPPTTTQPLLCGSPAPFRSTFPTLLPGAAQQARALHALLPQFTAPQRALGEQQLVSSISSAGSLNRKRHPIFWN